MTMPLSGTTGLGLATINMHTKFKVFISTHYEDTKRGTKFGK